MLTMRVCVCVCVKVPAHMNDVVYNLSDTSMSSSIHSSIYDGGQDGRCEQISEIALKCEKNTRTHLHTQSCFHHIRGHNIDPNLHFNLLQEAR